MASRAFAVLIYLMAPVHGYDCDFIGGCGSRKYCCGENECCIDASSIWYIWAILAVGFVAAVVSTCCKCYSKRNLAHVETTVITQAQLETPAYPVQYGAIAGTRPHDNWQNQPRHVESSSSLFESTGHFTGVPGASQGYAYVPTFTAPPHYQQVPVKNPNPLHRI